MSPTDRVGAGLWASRPQEGFWGLFYVQLIHPVSSAQVSESKYFLQVTWGLTRVCLKRNNTLASPNPERTRQSICRTYKIPASEDQRRVPPVEGEKRFLGCLMIS